MLKKLLVALILVSSCSSDNNNNDSCSSLTSFIEPPTDFSLTRDDIIAQFGMPSNTIGNDIFYDGYTEAEDTRKFIFNDNSIYIISEIFICNSESNYNDLVNIIEGLYGDPTFTEDDITTEIPGYLFSGWNVVESHFSISIAFNPATEFFVISYSNNP